MEEKQESSTTKEDFQSVDISYDDKIREVERRLNLKRDHLRQLKLVMTYRDKNEIQDLDKDIKKWQGVCQAALVDFHCHVKQSEFSEDPSEAPITMSQFLDKLGVDKSLVKYDLATEAFNSEDFPNKYNSK